MKTFSKIRLLNLFKKEFGTLFPTWHIKSIVIRSNDICLDANINANTYRFIVVPCTYPYPSFIESILKKSNLTKQNLLLLATYFPPGSQDYLIKKNVNFADLSGNCYIERKRQNTNKSNSFSIEIRDKPNRYPALQMAVDIFSKKSSRIVRSLLQNYPNTLKALDLAKTAEVSPALVTKATKAIEEMGFITIQKRVGIRLIEPDLLLDEWASRYSMKKNRIIGKYYCQINPRGNLVSKAWSLLSKKKVILTGTAGASMLAPFADVTIVELYIKDFLDNVNGIVPVERGENIRIYEPYDEGVFDFVQKKNNFKIAGNIQLYLDLMATPTRGKEQAAFLRERLIKF